MLLQGETAETLAPIFPQTWCVCQIAAVHTCTHRCFCKVKLLKHLRKFPHRPGVGVRLRLCILVHIDAFARWNCWNICANFPTDLERARVQHCILHLLCRIWILLHLLFPGILSCNFVFLHTRVDSTKFFSIPCRCIKMMCVLNTESGFDLSLNKVWFALIRMRLPTQLFCSVQSLDWSEGGGGGMEDDSAEILLQSFLQEALVSSSGISRDVRSLMLSTQHFLCCPRCCPPSNVPWRMVLGRLLWCVTRQTLQISISWQWLEETPVEPQE